MTQELDTAVDFDVDAAEDTNFDVVPNGVYLATVKKVSAVRTKDGTGKRLKIQWALEDAPYKGRVIFDDQNVSLPGKDAATLIGQGNIKNRAHALGIQGMRDYSEMVGLSALIKVKTSKDDYGERNEVVTAKPVGGAAPAPRAAAAGAPAAAPARKKPSFV
jgi:hypothetical protein